MKLSDLQQELQTADPAAILVSFRVLDRVIRQEQALPTLLWRVPHPECYVVDRYVLFRHVEQEELELEPGRLLPATVLLLAQPSSEDLAASDSGPLLLKYWRRLFHAKLHQALQTLAETGKLSDDDVRKRIEEIGAVEFAEIRRVLTEDGYLAESADERTVYMEFVAVFLELQFFAASLLAHSFPALRNQDRIQQMLNRDVNAADLFSRTRLAGAPDPIVRSDTRSDESHDYYWKLVGKAERASKEGNTVGAAIIRTRAARVAPAAYTIFTHNQAEADLNQLIGRLKTALQLSAAEATEWLKDLPALLDKADQGARPVEATLLYELQKVCLDHERDIYALDLVEWLLSVGKRPIRRPLPSQRVVRITKHLRSAAQLLTRARLSDADREHLAQLLQTVLERSEAELRNRFRPILTETFQDVGFRPNNPPERAAFHKMIEELLDRITEYGFLTFGDLRDAISRNQLKLPDLVEPYDFLHGDPLFRLDRRLAALLDGVYRPAEIYLRWLEWFTALNFGTGFGRFITRFVTVPFGGPYLFVEAVAILLKEEYGHTMPKSVRYPMVILMGFFLLGLMHVPSFRQRCKQTAVQFGQLLRIVLIDWPKRALQITALRQLMSSWPVELIMSYLLKPLLVCVLFRFWLPEKFESALNLFLLFLAANFVLNSRPGLAAGEAVFFALGKLYELLRAGLLPGLVRLVLAVFKQTVDTVEYVLFTVDEWLRFRSGDSRFSMAVRSVLGVLWFPVSYLMRFYMLVLIEPGINPIKFPVCSLAAKFIYPFGVTLAAGMAELLAPLFGGLTAGVIAGSTVWLLPDAFGFLFWEMKENWRLYRANRSPNLQPAIVGAHGETVRRLLQPGFHSGILPKLFARLRRAERDAAETGNWQAVRVCGHELQKVERALQRLVDREVVELVRQSSHWTGKPLSAGRIALASSRTSLELVHPEFPAEPVWLDIEDAAGWLVAGVQGPGWLDRIAPRQKQAVTLALAGLFKLAGVDLVRQQIEANLPPEASCYEVTADELIVWIGPRGGRAIYYDWKTLDGLLDARAADGSPVPEWPVLDERKVIFGRVPLPWQHWVETWQKDQAGQLLAAPFNLEIKSPRVPVDPGLAGHAAFGLLCKDTPPPAR